MHIQDFKVVYICPNNNEKYKERKVHMDNMLAKMGFTDIEHYTPNGDAYPLCVKKATIDILTKHIHLPFLLLEDDVDSTGICDFDFVPGADALYCGLSKTDGCINDSFAHHSMTQIRLSNMPSTHAILYISKSYKQAVISLLQQNLNSEPLGPCIAQLQTKFVVLANRQPLFYQSEHIGSNNEKDTNIEIVYQPTIKNNYANRRLLIGVTANFNGSAFDASLPQVAVYLARTIKSLGHSVVYLIKEGTRSWFTDCSGACNIDSVELTVDKIKRPLDFVIEVGWFIGANIRKRFAKKNIMFIHEPAIFKDMEKSVYNMSGDLRDFTNVDALWTWSHISKNDSYYLQLLSRLPVFKSNLVWEPIFLEGYIKTAQAKQVGEIFICENNRSNHSSCVIPLTILSQIKKTVPNIKWTVSNAATIFKKQYFVTNTVNMLNLGKDISGNFKERERIIDYVNRDCCIISHQRWLPLKYSLIDAMYLGIPLIHNCKMIKSMKGGKYFYEYNQISQALECWEKIKNGDEKPDIVSVRNEIMDKWGPEIAKQEIPDLFKAFQ